MMKLLFEAFLAYFSCIFFAKNDSSVIVAANNIFYYGTGTF